MRQFLSNAGPQATQDWSLLKKEAKDESSYYWAIVFGGNVPITMGETQEMDQSLSDSTYWERDQTPERLQQLEVVSKTQENDKLPKHSLDIYTGDACESLTKLKLHRYQGTLLKPGRTLGAELSDELSLQKVEMRRTEQD